MVVIEMYGRQLAVVKDQPSEQTHCDNCYFKGVEKCKAEYAKTGWFPCHTVEGLSDKHFEEVRYVNNDLNED